MSLYQMQSKTGMVVKAPTLSPWKPRVEAFFSFSFFFPPFISTKQKQKMGLSSQSSVWSCFISVACRYFPCGFAGWAGTPVKFKRKAQTPWKAVILVWLGLGFFTLCFFRSWQQAQLAGSIVWKLLQSSNCCWRVAGCSGYDKWLNAATRLKSFGLVLGTAVHFEMLLSSSWNCWSLLHVFQDPENGLFSFPMGVSSSAVLFTPKQTDEGPASSAWGSAQLGRDV